jgi:CHAT domain-containing protein
VKPAGWRAAVWIGLIFLALAGPALDGCKPREPGPTQLRPAHPVAAALALGQTRDFVFTVPPGSLLHLAVEQRGIDVILHLHLPDGREWMVVDSPGGSWGTEEIFALAEVAGEYRLSVAPDESARKSGSYSVALAPFHAPSPQEKDRARASSALAEGDRLRRSGTAQNLKAALGPLQQALTISEWLKNPRLQAITHYRMGQAYRDLRQRDAAYRHFDSARLLFLQMGDRIRVADLLRKIAQLQFQQGEVPQARDTAQQALHLFREDRKSDEAELANCLNDLALYEKNLGEIGKAVERYNEALRAYRKLGLIHEQVTVLNNLAKLYVGIGEIDQARTCIEDIHDLLARSGISDPAGEARGLVTLGGALEKAGDLKESERVLRRAVDLLRGAHELPTETAARLQLAKTLIAASRFDEARKLLEETRPLSRSIGDPVSEGQVLTNMAVVLAHDGKGGEALRLLDRALLYFRGMSDPDRTALTLIEKAKIQQQAGDLGGAVSTVREALEVEEGLRQNLERTLRVSLAADRRTHSDLLIDLLMDHFAQEGDSDLLDAAYEAQESSQARTVLEDLVESQQAAQREGLPESSQSQQIAQLLRNRTLEWQRLEGEDAEGDSGEDHRQEVVALEKSIQKLLEQQARAQAEQRAESVGPGQPWRSSLTLKEIQAEVLDPSKVLLSYHLGADRGFLWVVTSTSIEYHALPPSDEIDGLVRRARRYLEREQPWREREVLPVLRRLSEILIEPAGERLAGKKLLISPDGSLLRLPFSVLPSPGSAGTYRPLHQDHAIVMVPSASVQAGLRRLHKGRRPAPGVIAVLANPVFGPGDERLPDRPTASRGRSGLPWLPPFSFQRGPESNRRNQPGLPPLPYSEDEARAILALAPPGPRRLALGFDANVALVRGEQLRNYRYLHFATHALLHSQPDLSRLVLSQLDRQGREQEGVLLAYQISQLDLPVEMVVLSACETGRVEEKGNEEVSGLARAFLYAGARRVVASLWKVEDLPTAELMKHFYRALWQEGLPPAEALSQAQNKMRQTDWSEPSYWAGFVIVGED